MNRPLPVVVLVETMGSANLGAVARSATAFGLSSFRLVAPRCEIDEETRKWACYGKRILPAVALYDDLHTALADITFAVALSRREGRSRHKHYSLPVLADKILPELADQRLAFVFGNEESGLSLDHLKACHCSAEIPVAALDGSLNLAHAVTVTLYEWLGRARATDSAPLPKNHHEQPATPQRINDLMDRCKGLLARIGYPHHRSTLEQEMVKLEAITAKAQLEDWEVRLLFGMLKQLDYRLDNP
ncbi:MAG: TrmH family RNA methyltransferase [Vulcanimicrobiota bacterium]